MTADNPGALVPVFQGNDGIRQSIMRSFRACLTHPAPWIDTAQMQGQRKKQFAQSLAFCCSDIHMQMQ